MTLAARSEDDGLQEVTRRIFAPRIKTLVVDDDAVARELVLKILRRAGHVACSASSAEEALALFEQEDPDLVLMDVMLPGMSGVQAMRLMKKARKDRWLPVILISVRDSSAEVLEGLRAGADDYVTKPIVIDQLLAKLKNFGSSLALHARLRGSLQFTRAVMEHMVEGLLCIDERGLVLASNRSAEILFGFQPGHLLGVDLRRLINEHEMPEELAIDVGLQLRLGARENGERFPLAIHQTSVKVDGVDVRVITVRDVSEQLRQERRVLNDAARLREYRDAHEAENELAGQMLDKLLRRERSVVRSVHSHTEAAAGFSGDVVAAVRSPGGKLFVMLADATGHGLSAAISLVPALSVLHAMVERDRSLSEIVSELNAKLLDLLPAGRFMAAAIVCLDQSRHTGSIWVGGVPPVFLLTREGAIVERFDSQQLPLGIVPSTPELARAVDFIWRQPLQMLLVSDGILEAENAEGQPFGERRLFDAISDTKGHDRIASVSAALQRHLCGLKAGDDASVAFVDLD